MATLYPRTFKNGISYTLQWMEGRKRKTKSLGFISKDSAEIKLREKEIEILRGIDSVDVPKFREFSTRYMQWYKSQYPSSFFRVEQAVNQHLDVYFGDTYLDRVDLQMAEDYQRMRIHTQRYPKRHDLANIKIKASTVNKELRILKAMINKAIAWNYITRNPLKEMKSLQELDSKAPEIFTPREMKQIYKKATRPHWWKFLANTGLRVSEAQNLKWINIGEKIINIESTGQRRTKSGKWREIPITDSVREALKQFKATDTTREYVFPPIDRRSFSRAAKKDIVRAGLTGSAHKYRHTFCSNHVMNGTNLRVIQLLAGHSDMKVTEKYARMSNEFIENLNVNI